MNKFSEELMVIAESAIADEFDQMSEERLTRLFMIFHTWATKKATSLSPGAPVATQILDGMLAVEKAIHGKEHLTGSPAVKVLLDAMAGHFTIDAPPVRLLMRKYGTRAIEKLSPKILRE
jgi:hypothetical protein